MVTIPRIPSQDGWFRAEDVEFEPHRMLDPEGDLVGERKPSLDAERVERLYELMLLSRVFDERATALNRQGRFGGFAPASGQEACQVGSAAALDPDRDWVVPQYRELPALVTHGYPLERLAAISLGKPDGMRVPDGVRALPPQFSLAAHLPHAVGLAWGRRMQGHEEVVIAYCGEGAGSEGDFHEACNLAGVLRAPVVFIVQNNGWAISTPARLQSAVPTVALRALGYGFDGAVVDGNDLLAVHDVTSRAVAQAREGRGPVLVEALTYRLSVHNMTDDPRRYQSPEELDRARELDPLDRVRLYLRRLGRIDLRRERELRARATEQVVAAIAAAGEMRPAEPADLFEHVFAVPTPDLERQRRSALGEDRDG